MGLYRLTGALLPLLLAASLPAGGQSRPAGLACRSPAPLLGRPRPPARGYLVAFHDSTAVVAELSRLVARYAIAPRFVYQRLPGFSAELPASVLAALRCERAVKHITHDAPACSGSSEPGIVVGVVTLGDTTPPTGVRGEIREGRFVESLRDGSVMDSTGQVIARGLQGAFERAGTYTVVLRKPGYHDWVLRGIRVRRGYCHVETVYLRAVLVPRTTG